MSFGYIDYIGTLLLFPLDFPWKKDFNYIWRFFLEEKITILSKK